MEMVKRVNLLGLDKEGIKKLKEDEISTKCEDLIENKAR